MNVEQICIPENEASWWWLIMPPDSPARNIVVELNYTLENWWFSGRRNYHAETMQKLLDRGGELHKIKPAGERR